MSAERPNCGTVRKPTLDPSPAEIRELCLAIQAEWGDHEREKRSVARRGGWIPPAHRARLPGGAPHESD